MLAIVAYLASVSFLPYPAELEQQPSASTTILDRRRQPVAAFVADDGQWRFPLSQEQVSPHLAMAIVAVEDGRFYSHHGVDWWSAASAIVHQSLHPTSRRRGASTITMQLQRLRQPAARTWAAKWREAVIAGQIERRQSKSQILLEYINRAPFGANLVGAEAASEKYFGRSCRQLSLGQAALLAGIPQSPKWLRPDRFPQRARERRNHVLDRMLACKFITQEQHDEASAEPIEAAWHPAPQSAGTTSGALPTMLTLAAHGGNYLTTIDSAVQRQTYEALTQQLSGLGTSNIDAAAAVVLDTATSEVLASVSVQASLRRGIDLTRRPRSTGSTLKPFIYAAAFEAGILGPKSILEDSPAAWPGYQPNDFDRAFRGQLSASEALAESRNIPAMLVLERVGVEPAAGVMASAGMSKLANMPERFGLTLAVGGAEVSPLELAGAYAALGRGGISKPTTFEAPEQTQSNPTRILSRNSCWQVLDALSAPDRTRGLAPEAVRTHVAWKTGTSSGRRDAWCAAVTRTRTIVVWFGNVRGGGSMSLVGQDAAAPVALRLMAALAPAAEPWPNVPDATPRSLPSRSDTGSLVIMSPAPGAEIVLSNDLPEDHQRVLLDAAARGEQELPRLWWFVDDRPLTVSATAGSVWWNASRGSHVVRVTDSMLHSATARITVR